MKPIRLFLVVALIPFTTNCSRELSRDEAKATINKTNSYPQTVFAKDDFQLQLPKDMAATAFAKLHDAGFVTLSSFTLGPYPYLSAELTAKGKEHVADGEPHATDGPYSPGYATSRPITWSAIRVKEFVVTCDEIINIFQLDPKQADVKARIKFEADPFAAMISISSPIPGGSWQPFARTGTHTLDTTFHLARYDSGWGMK